jgi:hypothetical protein
MKQGLAEKNELTELEAFNSTLIRLGTVTILAGIVANFLPALYIYMRYGAIPPVGDLVKIWLLVGAAFGVAWIVQPVSFFPLIGTSGSYIAWLAGSVADLRTPASTMAQRSVDVETGTLEGDLVSTIAISTSVFVSVAIITIFTFLGSTLLPLLPAPVKASFNYILPAVFAAVYADLSIKDVKFGLVVLAASIAATILGSKFGVGSAWMYLISVTSGMLLGVLFFKMKAKTQA